MADVAFDAPRQGLQFEQAQYKQANVVVSDAPGTKTVASQVPEFGCSGLAQHGRIQNISSDGPIHRVKATVSCPPTLACPAEQVASATGASSE